jgi:hypothetical protein
LFEMESGDTHYTGANTPVQGVVSMVGPVIEEIDANGYALEAPVAMYTAERRYAENEGSLESTDARC